jgi:hypothetical protein
MFVINEYSIKIAAFMRTEDPVTHSIKPGTDSTGDQKCKLKYKK